MTRVVSGALLGLVFFGLVWFGTPLLLLIVAMAVGALALHEYAEIVRQIGARVPRVPVTIALLATIAAVPMRYAPLEVVIGLGVVMIAIVAMLTIDRGQPAGDAPTASAAAMRPAVAGSISGAFALAYLGLPLGALVGIFILGGPRAVVLLVATIAISDTAQYYSGRTFGRRPLAPIISPKKTIEGALGGFVAAPLFLAGAGPLLLPPLAPAPLVLLGLVLVVCGIAGDLFESMLKRAADLKDSSALIPGHGGVLDRIDALLFAAPPFYLYLRWVVAA